MGLKATLAGKLAAQLPVRCVPAMIAFFHGNPCTALTDPLGLLLAGSALTRRLVTRVAITILLITLLILPFIPTPTLAAGWDADYGHRRNIVLNGQAGAGTDYSVLLKVGESAGAVGEDFDVGGNCTDFPSVINDQAFDIAFTDNDETTELYCWVDNVTGVTPNRTAAIWVKVTDDISAGNPDIYCYYGSATHFSSSDIVNTFIEGDDFEWGNNGDSIDTSGGGVTWTLSAGDSDISTTQAYSGTRSMDLIATGTTAQVYNNYVASDNAYAVYMKVYKTDASRWAWSHGDGISRPNVFFWMDENLRYYDVAYQNTGFLGTADQWGRCEFNNMDFTAATFDWIWNGVKIGDNLPMRVNNLIADQMGLIGYTVGDCWVDDFIIRKWVTTEPSFNSAGPAEAATCLAPVVVSFNATSITGNSAFLSGNITTITGCNATMRGFRWGIATGNYSSNWTQAGSFGVGTFNHTASGLSFLTTYYWQAMAETPGGFNASLELSFTTLPDVCLAPTNFIATQTGINSITLNWTKGAYANTTIIRCSYTSQPSSLTDGYLVYNGTGSSLNITGLSLGGFVSYFISGWSHNILGYSADYASTSIGGTEMLIPMILLIISFVLMFFSYKTRDLLLCVLDAAAWWATSLYLFFTGTPIFDLGESYTQILIYVFFGLSFIPLIWSMNRSIQREAKGQKGLPGMSWNEEGNPPSATHKETELDRYWANKERIRRRLYGR